MKTRTGSSKAAVAAKYAGFALRALRRDGLAFGAMEFASECWFDLRRGTDTLRPREVQDVGLAAGAFADAVQYQGASPRLVRRLLESLPAAARAGAFVDYGCGKGRVLLLAAETGFRKLSGVEFDPVLAAVARRNLQRRLGSMSPDVRLHVMDAARFEPPRGALTAFLYNPFGGETLRQVVRQLGMAARRTDEPVRVVYVNPVGLDEFTRAGFGLDRIEERRGHAVAAILKALGAGPRP